MRLRRASIASFLLAAGCAVSQAPSVVVLVRHAEKVDESRDAELSEQGKERARALAAMLKDAGIETIYSTDYIRTRDTARPLAEALSKEIELYDGDDLEGLARKLRANGSRALVVGHLDTTPALVRILGGREGSPIDPEEYDRLYLVTLLPDGKASATILRFCYDPPRERAAQDEKGVER